jgi:hypothetical protein
MGQDLGASECSVYSTDVLKTHSTYCDGDADVSGLDTVGKQPNSDNIAAPGRPEETQRLLCALRMMDAILTIGSESDGSGVVSHVVLSGYR